RRAGLACIAGAGSPGRHRNDGRDSRQHHGERVLGFLDPQLWVSERADTGTFPRSTLSAAGPPSVEPRGLRVLTPYPPSVAGHRPRLARADEARFLARPSPIGAKTKRPFPPLV